MFDKLAYPSFDDSDTPMTQSDFNKYVKVDKRYHYIIATILMLAGLSQVISTLVCITN